MTTVVCIICENVWHINELEQCGEAIFYSKNLVICPEHVDLNLTSKIDEQTLNQTARLLIVQIKLYQREQVKKELLKDLDALNTEQLNETIHVENNEPDKLATENMLLLMKNYKIRINY